MKTNFWHIGIASALIGTMGLAQAQTTPAAESPNSAPAIVEQPVGASGSVTGIESPTPSAPTGATASGKNWNNASPGSDMGPSRSMDQASPSASTDASTTEGPLVGAPERGNQSSNNSDGLNVPSAYGVGGASGSAR